MESKCWKYHFMLDWTALYVHYNVLVTNPCSYGNVAFQHSILSSTEQISFISNHYAKDIQPWVAKQKQKTTTHQTTSSIVMQINPSMDITCSFSRQSELSSEPVSEFDIMWTASPLEIVPDFPVHAHVTATGLEFPHTAGLGHLVGDARRGQGVSESWLSVPCEKYSQVSSWVVHDYQPSSVITLGHNLRLIESMTSY